MMTEAVLYVDDLEALAAFYREAIGLVPVETGDGYRGVRAGELTLWLVRTRRAPGADRERDGAVRPRSEVPLKLAFEVDGLERAAPAVERLGGSIATRDWEFAGYRRRDAVDPEGNVIQLLEPLADR